MEGMIDRGAGPVVMARGGNCLSPEKRRFNIALWKLVKGEGSVLANLAIVASFRPSRDLTIDAIKGLVKRVEHTYRPEDIEPRDGLDRDERQYLVRRYASEADPAVREWLRQNCSPQRSRPDWRRSSDRVGKVGKSKRVRASRVD